MATSRAYTSPKGRPTPTRDHPRATVRGRRPRARAQWTLVVVLLAALLVGLLLVGGGGTGGPIHGG